MAQWQKHWSNSASDPRMQLLITEMGPKGYGIYWLISERIKDTGNDCVMRQEILRKIRSRKLNKQYIQQVLDGYYLFETSPEGLVQHHPIALGDMSAHTLHNLISGKIQSPAEMHTVCAENGTNGTHDATYYNVRAGENRTDNKNITCMTHVKGLDEHPKVKEAIGELASKPWCIHILALFNPLYCMWRQTTCLHSGYPTLLDRHWEDAVVEFVHHIIALDRADEIRSDQNAHYYFANFVNKYHPSGKKLLAKLKEKERNVKVVEPAPSFPGTHSYEDSLGGKRYADGKPIPAWAPPRPSATAVWDAGSERWIELYK